VGVDLLSILEKYGFFMSMMNIFPSSLWLLFPASVCFLGYLKYEGLGESGMIDVDVDPVDG
jgi:hypothetical protein